MTSFACASCRSPITQTFMDLGEMPSANAFLRPDDLDRLEPRWPLRAAVCSECFLIQLDHQVAPEHLFSSYVYFSSYASSWVEHARRFAEAAIKRFRLGPQSRVLEVASNDGYMLKHFKAAGIPVLGIEPAANVAQVAKDLGIETMVEFFSEAIANDLAAGNWGADLVIANNVLAHVPTINDFVSGLAAVLKEQGVLSVEFPHLLKLIDRVEFDTIYHEHFFYYSLLAVETLFARHGLAIFDVEQLPTHGGSLRVYAARTGSGQRASGPELEQVRQTEKMRGLDRLETYLGFEERARACREAARMFVAACRRDGKRVVGYGAAAKGNTFLNYTGIGPDDLLFVSDLNPAKQGLYLPGTLIPVRPPEAIFEARPDYVVILPWNLRHEITTSMAGIREWGGRFVTLVPDVRMN